MNDIENVIMKMLVAGDDPVLHVLQQQLEVINVGGRKQTGVGFFTQFALPSTAPRVLNIDRLVIGDVYAELEELSHPAGFLLFLGQGLITTLECFVTDSIFPKEAKLKRAYYVGPKSVGDSSLHEILKRNIVWALKKHEA